jgi:hypothetical protein
LLCPKYKVIKMGGIRNKTGKFYLLLPTALLLVVMIFSGCSTTINSDTSEFEVPDELANLYQESLTSPLERAISETEDTELAQFSQKLLDSYHLTQTENDGDSAGSIASLLPDVKYINQVAMETTLVEAGKTLKDPELSEFYSSFIQRIGIDD